MNICMGITLQNRFCVNAKSNILYHSTKNDTTTKNVCISDSFIFFIRFVIAKLKKYFRHNSPKIIFATLKRFQYWNIISSFINPLLFLI